MRISDWSSEVCSSDLNHMIAVIGPEGLEGPADDIAVKGHGRRRIAGHQFIPEEFVVQVGHRPSPSRPGVEQHLEPAVDPPRADEGHEIGRASLGKECVSTFRSRWSAYT